MDAAVAASWVAVAGTLGGVVVGTGLDWVRSRGSEQRAAGSRRDEHYVALMDACTRLQIEAMTLRRLMAADALPAGLAEVGEILRRDFSPLVSELALMAARLSIAGDEPVSSAAGRLVQAAVAALNIYEPDEAYAAHRDELQAAVGQLRRARDAAAAPWWGRQKMRRAVSP